MILRETSLPKFIFLSLVFHFILFGITYLISSPNKEIKTVEISFGSGNSRGGSGPKSVPLVSKVKTPKATPQVTKPKVRPMAPKVANLDAPVVAQTETANTETLDTSTSETTQETGSGLNTGTGMGSGTTSGSGAGFNDPKIRYRGEIYQLVNSKKIYPRKARALQQEGTVVAKLKLAKDGKLLHLEIIEESKFKILTKATLDAIKSIKKFPDIPNEMGLNEITINIPFEYEIRHGDII